jgi:hypothetical protein
MRLPFVALGLAIAACGGPMRAYPRWILDDEASLVADCLHADALMRVSGKTGVGLTLAMRSTATCRVLITRAELILDDDRAAATLPPAQTLPDRSLSYAWLPFAFDNNAAWNRGSRRGRFEIDVVVGDAPPRTWVIPAHHAFVDGRYVTPALTGVAR